MSELHSLRSVGSSGRRGLLCALGALVLCLGSAALVSARPATQETGAATSPGTRASGVSIFLVRHAEKGTDDPRDPSLTDAGRARAVELARVFGATGVTKLFSTDLKRTRQTLEPLAESTGLEIEVYDPAQIAEQLEGMPAGSVVVVAGHSNTTPALFQELSGGAARDLEEDPRHGRLIPDGDYDRLYSLTLATRPGDAEPECIAALELRYGAPSKR